ncbi:hypothetical protein AB6A40_010015 [Gnathostoma spinigerum]|uniref:Uncharacterized protein n=1 Tax=Gnathostoma spinigerum TaxID=75299 RepID=A0ABD6F0A9_9BILA
MGLTKQYLKYVPSGTCNIVGSSYGTIAAVNDTVCAVTACENVSFYNLRKTEKVNEFPGSENNATALKFSDDHQWLAVGYSDGYVRLFHQKSDGWLLFWYLLIR